jgi:hypothetical protein
MPDLEMKLECAIRGFLGKKAYHCCDSGDKKMQKLLNECKRKILEKIDKIDSTNPHKQRLMYQLNFLDLKISLIRMNGTAIGLLDLISSFLGFNNGNDEFELLFCKTQTEQDKSNCYNSLDELKTVISARQKIINILKKDGHNDYEVAKILNISENQVKKLKNNI